MPVADFVHSFRLVLAPFFLVVNCDSISLAVRGLRDIVSIEKKTDLMSE